MPAWWPGTGAGPFRSMLPRLFQGLPPVLSDYIARKIETGAAVYKPVELNTVVPTRGPYVMDLGGA